MKTGSRRPERPLQKVRRSCTAALARFGIDVIGRLPYGVAGGLGASFGSFGYWLNRRESRRAVEHLARAFPDESPRWHRRTAARLFSHIGRVAGEFVVAVRWTPEQRVRRVCVNPDELASTIEADTRDGCGMVFITAHFGLWEMLGACIVATRPLTVVARRLNDPRLSRLADNLRERAGMKVVYQDAWPRPLLRALREREVVGILPDQDVHRLPGIFAPFFGKDAYTPTAPVELAQRCGATMRMGLFARDPDGYRIIFSDRMEVPSKEEGAEGLRRATLAWTRFLEEQMRQRPWQWMWMHRRWRTRPQGESDSTSNARLSGAMRD